MLQHTYTNTAIMSWNIQGTFLINVKLVRPIFKFKNIWRTIWTPIVTVQVHQSEFLISCSCQASEASSVISLSIVLPLHIYLRNKQKLGDFEKSTFFFHSFPENAQPQMNTRAVQEKAGHRFLMHHSIQNMPLYARTTG